MVAPPLLLNERYLYLRELGRGGMGRVCLVIDTRRGGEQVALKTFRPASPTMLEAFKREFEILSGLRHPNLARVHDFGAIRDARDPFPGSRPAIEGRSGLPVLCFFTTEYVEGPDLRRGIRPYLRRRPPDWGPLYEIAVQLCRALEYIHSRNLLHYDVKPENAILVSPSEAGALRVKLIDFGLSQPDTTPLGARVRGTFPYMSPELLRRSVVDRRADLYSLGATLFVLATGTDPFEGRTEREIIRRILQQPPPPVRSRAPAVPADLAAVIDRLLAKDPAERFGSATEVIEAISRSGPRRFEIETPETRASYIWGGKLVGRRQEVRAFGAEIESLEVEESDCALVLVEGEPGVGRTRLMEEVSSMAQMSGVAVITGTCPPGTPIPFAPWREIFEELRDHVDLNEPRFARFLPALAALLPDVRPPGVSPPLEPRRARARLLDALARLVIEVAGPAKLLVWIRNLERADPASIELVEALVRAIQIRRGAGRAEIGGTPPPPSVTPIPPSPLEEERAGPYPRVLLCATTEPVAYAKGPLERLAGAEGVRRIRLKPLDRDQTAELVASRLGPSALSERALDELHVRSRGIPILVEHMLEALFHERRAAAETGGWPTVRPEDVRALPDSLAEFARRAADEAGDEAEAIIEVLSLARFPLPPEAIAEASGLEIQRVECALDGIAERHIARILRVGGRAAFWLEPRSFAQERAERVPPSRARRLHRRLAAWFAREGWPEPHPEPAVPHAAEAGAAKRARKAALRTARRYAACLAFERARDVARLAVDLAGSEDLPPEALAALAETCEAAGDAHGAMELLTAASERTAAPAATSRLLRRIGEIAGAAGDAASAQPALERALALVEDTPRSPDFPRALAALARLHLERGHVERAEALYEQAVDRREILEPPERARLLRLGGRIHSARDDHAGALACLRDAVQILREGGASPDLAGALLEMGKAHAAKGDYDGAIRAFREAFEVYEELGDKWGLAEVTGNVGQIFYSRGDHERAREYYGRSLLLREEVSDRRGKASALNNLGLVHGMRNELEAARACFQKSLGLLADLGDEAGMAVALNNVSKLHDVEGRYAEALDATFRALEKRKRIDNRAGIAFSYYRIGHIYRHQGELDKARGYAEKSLRIRKELGDRVGIAHAHRLLGDIQLAQGNTFEAFRHFRQSLSSFESFGDRIGRIDLYCLMALTSLRVGLLEEAEGFVARSLQIARENDLRFHVGQALRYRGLVEIEKRALYEADGDLAKAERIFREFHSRRDQAHVLLDRAHLCLELEQPDRAVDVLERAYAVLEETQPRDLAPAYFLLRGRAEMERSGADLELAERLLNRGVLEAKEIELPELVWRLYHQLARLAERRGRPAAAAAAIRQALTVLGGLFDRLPIRFKETYYDVAERQAVRAMAARLADVPEPAEAPAPPAGDAPRAPEAPPALPAPAKAAGGAPARARPARHAAGPLEELARMRARNLNLERLQEITEALNSELVLDKVLEKIMDATLELVNAERGFLILRGEDGDRFYAARNLDGEAVDAPQDQISHSIAHEVMRTGRPLIADEALRDERLARYKSVRDLKLQSILCLPLRARDRIIGTLYLDNRFVKNAFSPADVGILETLCDQAAIAIENARLVEENLRRRRELEQSYRKIAALNRRLEEKLVRQEVALAEVRRDLAEAKLRVEHRFRFENLIGRSPRMIEVFRMLEKVAPTDLPVLIEGESGTGKELVAYAIHYQSPRRERRLILENCGALTETLLESELFGHTRGAFTGAVAERKGLFELANGGTLFLDEVGDLSLGMQKKLLRVLQEGEIRRVGGKQTLKVDVRILSASNRPLRALVADGSFREDLFYRLNVIRIELPPLRERLEDLPLLAEHFLEEIAGARGGERRRLSPGALRKMLGYHWPGNVRELKHFLERTVLLTQGEVIQAEDVVLEAIEAPPPREVPEPGAKTLREAREAFVQEYLTRALEAAGGVVSRAARLSGVSRESFHRMCRKYGLR